MKYIVFVLCCIVVASGEPPRYSRFRFQRQQLAQEAEPITEKAAPYPASGWTPAGEAFTLPPPQQQNYGVPANEYGVSEGTTASEEETTTPSSDDDTLLVEGLEPQQDEKKSERLDDGVERVQGAYYVLLPDGQLQRVEFKSENDLRNMAYTTRLEYRSEDAAPVYVLQPDSAESNVQQYAFLPRV